MTVFGGSIELFNQSRQGCKVCNSVERCGCGQCNVVAECGCNPCSVHSVSQCAYTG